MKPCCDKLKLAIERKLIYQELMEPAQITDVHEVTIQVPLPLLVPIFQYYWQIKFETGDRLTHCPYCWAEIPNYKGKRNSSAKEVTNG